MAKRTWLWTVLALPLLVTACGQGGGGSAATNVPANAQTVHVTATDFKWTLDHTTFKAGVPIDFIVESKEGAHGFAINGTSISQMVVQGQAPVHVVWNDPKPGTYTIECNYYCGSGHPDMHTTITVK
jgi:cytochrome c oxidase subunit 2